MTALKENQTVAEKYIKLQSQHMNRKNQFLSSYEKSLIAQEKLSDKENVSIVFASLTYCTNMLLEFLIFFVFYKIFYKRILLNAF